MKIVWLSGYAGAGKDTIAAILCKKHDYYRVAFADILKDMVSLKYVFPRELCDTGKDTSIRGGQTVRELLIADSARAKTENINVFAEHALHKIIASGKQRIVISDWRFPHEFTYIKENLPEANHVTIRITRPGLQSLLDPSEHALDDWVFMKTIENTDMAMLEYELCE